MEGELIKVHVVIRCDLGMTKGKICAQAAHAVLGLYKDLQTLDEIAFAQWASLDFGQETYQGNSHDCLFKVE
jgi:peptidyl-tRNA hydrolase